MIKNFLSEDEPERRSETEAPPPATGSGVLGLFDPGDRSRDDTLKESTDFQPLPTEPTSLADDARGMGLAYSAGIAFTAAVVFMLVLGWGADVLLGTSPWGIVVGIVVGSIIGFVQLFRITSQIFKK